MIESTDPYVYPGTDVLKNRRDIRDFAVLAEFEVDATAHRLTALISSPVAGNFATPHIKALHKYIFQDIWRPVSIPTGSISMVWSPNETSGSDRMAGHKYDSASIFLIGNRNGRFG